MRKTIGRCCILLGILCLAASAGFVVYNHWEANSAASFSGALLDQAHTALKTPVAETPTDFPSEEGTGHLREMPTAIVDGYDCVGILSIPVLELELPVLTDWSYEKLKKAPCHYFGSCYGENFVIAAHNYPSHFGRLSELLPEDLIVFTDMEGTPHIYRVVLRETLQPTATEEMITSGFDLSLYTCTPGGRTRVTVRCEKIG